jgi:type I restriction enzyme S subunit
VAEIEAYKKFRQGMVEGLLSGNIGIPTEEAAEEWQEKSIGEIAERVTSSYDPRSSSVRPPLVELENIESGTGSLIDHSQLDGQLSVKTRFSPGDVLFGKLRPYLRKYAQPSFAGVCSSEIWVLRGLEVSSSFLFYLVQSEHFIQRAIVSSSGSKMPRADWGTVERTEFLIPGRAEQDRIVGVLTKIDQKMRYLSAQLVCIERFKKGLLEKMFV